MSRRVTRAAVAAVLLLTAGLAAGCSDDETPTPDPTESTGPRPLTSEEADLLAGARAQNYRREVVPFAIELPVESNIVTLVGRADMREHVAVAGGTSSSAGKATFAAFAWNLARMAVVDTEAAPTQQELAQTAKIPTKAWQVHDLAGSSQRLDQVALVFLNLALDRNDNAQLLRQNGAQFRGTTTVDGTDVVIMTASSGGTLTYYLDPETARMVRVDVNVGTDRPATITFLDGDEASVGAVPVVKALGTTPDTQPEDTPG